MFLSAMWKHQARESLRNHWLTGLLIALIVNLPSLLVQGIAAFTGNDLMTRAADVVYGAISAGGSTLDPEAVIAGFTELQNSAGIWVMQGLNLAAWLMTPCLTFGMLNWMLMLLRKQPAGEVSTVFSRLGLFLKGIGLRLYVALRIFLWMLPGIALNIASLIPLWLSDSSSKISVLSAVNTSVGLQTAALAVTLGLGILAALKYALADLILADHPEKGPVQAAGESRETMKGKRGALFSLYASFLLWYLLEIMATNAVISFFGSIPGLMTEMLASLALTVYLRASVTSFYLSCRPAEPEEPDAEEEEII